MHTLPPLPYDLDFLEPHISRETLEFHHGKHIQTYVDNLNNLIAGTEFENLSLEEVIIKSQSGGIFNNAAQIWNHIIYFDSMTKAETTLPSAELLDAIKKTWGELEIFIQEFTKSALGNFGSGWTWLVKNVNGQLEIVNTSNADTLLLKPEYTVLLACDVWEHSYYIDYRNSRAKYMENFFKVVNWDKISERFLKA